MNFKKLFLLFLLVFYCLVMQAQDCVIIGLVRDATTKEKMPGVNVIVDDTSGVVTDSSGKYMLNTTSGDHALAFRFIGYKTTTRSILLKPSEAKIINIDLIPSSTELGTVVVSAGKFEQKIEEVTVSMTVLSPSFVENTNTTSMDDAINQVPGVTVIDGQANIRGGSGFSYGAGSRVLMLVDDLPMLTADANDVKWSFLPTENLEQIEVLKGASSALFGSSAMNGVINIRTAYPKSKPETKITLFGGVYDSPENELYDWSGDTVQMTQGMSASHSQKFGRFDLVAAGNYFKDEGYKQGEHEEHFRVNANTRYSFDKNLEGLSAGVNANYMHTNGVLFFIWEDDSTGALIPQGGLDTATTTLSEYTTVRFNVDPFITYANKNGETHKIRTRYFKTDNNNNTNQQSFGTLYYGEYLFQKRFSENLTWTFGTSDMYSDVKSELYGDHFANNIAFYTQIDNKFNKWIFSFGARWEQNRIDTVKTQFIPVFRSGINYALFENTHLRTSYGEGYRFPSIAEKFITTNVGDINIFSNDTLQPEKGWTAEFGINQGFKISEWNASLDIAGFWQEYEDMMEFTFGVYGVPPAIGIGFASLNIGNTRIQGFDFTLTGKGTLWKFPVTILAGHTSIYPTYRDFDKINKQLNSDTTNVLKYRYRQQFKGDIEVTFFNHVIFGTSVRYNSFMENIDNVFNYAIDGVKHYRETHPDGDWAFDTRIFYTFLKHYDIGFIVKNVANHEYMGRPADLQQQRSFVVQARAKF
ncbi:MAG: TonB-dependent receptor domain-containing protein [Bacteroidia bacterium]